MKYYTIEKHNGKYGVWLNVEKEHSCYCRALYTGSFDACKKYARSNKIKIQGNLKDIIRHIPSWKEMMKIAKTNN